ncbi:hypothetical protein [Marinobacter pelagius]|uniref:Transposase n=1 Tax=Marinobacter pelagius TaxID=379482 RepID=A0A1I4UT43_9GAMM|nr:hypothetical protein [Marinobacter pelagius]SFM92122.1 hypothetical protein SAMN04487961_1558 [Marinobacter pelagius]
MIAEAAVCREAFQKMLKAKDGLKQAHMDVLVAVFWNASRHTAADLHPTQRKPQC